MISLFKKVEEYFDKHERHISSAALIGGFIFDSLTLTSVTRLFENLTIVSYLAISGGSIILLNYYEQDIQNKRLGNEARKFLPVLMQFAFGGLFSAFFIFYTRSATLASSWPFLMILFGLLIGNEFFKTYYEKLVFQVSIFFVAIFSFSIFFVPVLLKLMNAWVFVLSGGISLVAIYLFSRAVFKVVPHKFDMSQRRLRISVLTVYLVMNVLYFANLIPPIPLALKDSGIYYSVEKLGNSYKVSKEEDNLRDKFSFILPERVTLQSGGSLYAFSSVFAPTDLDTTIVHNWEYFDESADKWVSTSKIPFSIKGGRREGYRGFSMKDDLTAGKWRVDVETERRQIIGRIRFNIVITPEPATIIETKVI